MRTIDKIITPVNQKNGAPMGRPSYNKSNGRYKDDTVLYDCPVPMDGAYDKGGAYWGLGSQLRVKYSKDLTYVKFYRRNEKV